MRRAVLLAVVAAGFVLAGWPAAARDLGVRGASWAVAEPDLLEAIAARLEAMAGSGEWARLRAAARERVRRGLEEPAPAAGILPASVERRRRFDASVAVTGDIRGADGALIAAAGTRVDPLAHVRLSRDLLFIDGRREVEVAWALAHPRPAKIVLLAGRPLDLARRFGRAFFFDMGGRLAARLAITATPTLLRQEGGEIWLSEIPLDDREGGGGREIQSQTRGDLAPDNATRGEPARDNSTPDKRSRDNPNEGKE